LSSLSSTVVEVVAAVIYDPERTRVLLAERPPGKAYAGYWEFPGGKVEPGESLQQALKRELHEELGIEVALAHPWLTREFVYPHAAVRLNFFRVVAWHGEPHGREGQRFAWQDLLAAPFEPMLPANGPIFRSLVLPPVMGISCAGEMGVPDFMDRLRQALGQGMRLVQLREKDMSPGDLRAFVREAAALVHEHGGRVLLNSRHSGAAHCADGLHLTSADLMARSRRPEGFCGASCHDAGELARAREWELDYVLVGPVLPTGSHPGAPHLGWPGFATLARGLPMPVYALGGIKRGQLEQAWSHGAHGIAMLSGAWA
jgi:8-oxo-dGTP diphosphatase